MKKVTELQRLWWVQSRTPPIRVLNIQRGIVPLRELDALYVLSVTRRASRSQKAYWKWITKLEGDIAC